jgi:tetratricopeptide (TPR) repeat protein
MAYNNRGVAYGALEQHQKALADFAKAIELGPEGCSGVPKSCHGLQSNPAEPEGLVRL